MAARRLALLLGLGSVGAQTVLFREHLLAYAGNELGTGAFLAAWMLWIAVGAVGARTRIGRMAASGRVVLALFPLLVGLELVLLWELRRLAGIAAGEAFPLTSLLAWTCVATFPVSFATGYLFAWLARKSSDGVDAAKLYAFEAMGSGVGGLLAALGAWFGVGVGWLLPLLAATWWGSVGWLTSGSRVRRGLLGGIALVGVVAATMAGGQEVLEDARRAALPVPDDLTVEGSADTPWQHIAAAGWGEWQVLIVNGQPVEVFPAADQAVAAAAIHTLASAPQKTLVIGSGALGLSCEMQRRLPGKMVLVDQDRAALDFAARMIPTVADCLLHGGITVVHEDPLAYLQEAAGQDFDLVLYAVGEPQTAQQSRYYTQEFLRSVVAAMGPDATLTLTATATENVLAGPELAYVAGLYSTLSSVFGQVTFTAGERMRFFARRGPVPSLADPDWRRTSFEGLSVRYPELSPAFLDTLFEVDRIQARLNALEGAESPPNTRDRPGIYVRRIQVAEPPGSWFRKLAGKRGTEHLTMLALAALLLALLLAGGRGSRPPGRLVHLVLLASSGAVGMAGQVLLLLGFQLRFGTLYAAFGVLNAGFLVGLAAGSGGWPGSRIGRRVALVAPVLSALALVGLLAMPSGPIAQGLFLLAPMVLGTTVGAALRTALAGLERGGVDKGGQAVVLELLDHLGAVVGALMAGTVLVPFAGLSGTGYVLACAALVPVALALAERLGWRLAPGGSVPSPIWRVLLIWGLLLGGAISLAPEEVAPVGGERTSLAARLDSGGPEGSSWPRCRAIEGWGGPLEMLVHTDGDGNVAQASLGRHMETPDYIRGIDDWLKGLIGRPAATLTYDDVDAFTGATVTGRAAVAIVRCSVAPEAAGSSVSSPSHRADDALPPWPAWLVLATVLAGALVYFLNGWRTRTALLLFLAVLAGGWLNHQLDVGGFLRASFGPRPPLSNLVFWGLLGGAVLLAVLAGAVQCGTLCPAGAIQSLLGRIGLRLRVPEVWDRRLRQVKYAVAVFLVWGGLLAASVDWGGVDLLRFAFSGRYGIPALAMVLVVVAAGLVWHRPWCRYLCPLGAVLSVGERVSLAGRLAPARRTSACHLGVRVGRDWDCVRCNRCAGSRSLGPERVRGVTWHVPLLVGVVALLLSLGALRVVGGGPGSAGALPSSTPQGAEPAFDRPSDAADQVAPATDAPREPAPGSPRTFRRDNNPYPVQRRPGSEAIRKWLRASRLADEEALFYVPVEPDLSP